MTIAAPPPPHGASVLAPLLPVQPGEPMTLYFKRLRETWSAQASLIPSLIKVENMSSDGVYLFKRPLQGPSGQNPLAVCGSVFHHAIIYIKEGDQVHSLDFGPANGCDVTANIMESAPSRNVLAKNVDAGDLQAQQTTQGSCYLPYLYCGKVVEGLQSERVQQAIKFIESGPYHALWRNCIHACDLLLRCLTGGCLRNGPLLYDLLAGEVPSVDNPLIMMMQLMMRRSWMDVCDGSALAQEAAPLLGWADASHVTQQQPHDEVDQSSAAAVAALARAAMAAAVAGNSSVSAKEGDHTVLAQSN